MPCRAGRSTCSTGGLRLAGLGREELNRVRERTERGDICGLGLGRVCRSIRQQRIVTFGAGATVSNFDDISRRGFTATNVTLSRYADHSGGAGRSALWCRGWRPGPSHCRRPGGGAHAPRVTDDNRLNC